ncbi:MAG: SPOR domain-containing protein [Paramuribaculum sp.]|nr:SPOR domain-containing protein [Paramuribaculum sp.]
MIALNEHIKYLLRHHDCVVLPSFGAFIVRYEAATVKASGTQFLPPNRSLGFNAAIVDDDGLLAWSVSRREGISYREASAEVAAAVDSMSSLLDICGQVDIDRVGRLIRHSDSTLEFLPDELHPIVNAAFNPLPVLNVSPIVEVADDEPAILEVDFSERRSLGSRLWRATRYAASVAVLVGLGIAFSTPITLERMPAQASLALPSVTKPKPATVETPAVTADMSEKSELSESSVEKEPAVVMVKDLDTANPEENYDCFVVIASFASQADADRYIREAKSADSMRVIKADGRYRVYIAVGTDYDATFDFKSTDAALVAEHPTAWVYRK